MTQLAVQPVKVVLPPLHSGQKVIDKSPARFKCVICGRRFGKTTYGVRECTKGALENPGVYWWVGPNFPSISASAAWPTLKRLIAPIEGVIVREAERYITFPNGSEIWVKSADNPNTLRGPKLKGVVLDEFAQIKEETWNEVLRPALADHKGWALFIGTPKGKNWAYRLFELAKHRPNWEAFQIPTAITEDGTANTKVIGTNNPVIDPNELEDSRMEMSAEQFAQEFLADFGVSQYLVYPEIIPEIHTWKGPVPEFISYHGGMDFGGDSIGAHASVTVVAGRTSQDDLIIFDCFKQAGPNIAERQLNWTIELEQKIADLRRFNKQRAVHAPIYRADKTQSVGIQFMRRYGITIFKTEGGPDSVTEGIELVHRRLKLRLDPLTGREKPKLYVLEGCPWVMNDMLAYRYAEPAADREPRKNPLKINDDVADAVRYLVEGVDRRVGGNPQELYKALIPRMI